MIKEGLEWLKAILIGVFVFIIIQWFFFTNYEVEGGSMKPTLQDGDKLVVDKISYRFGEINRFDVIVFHANENEDYVKRVIGIPGDEIEYKNDQLFINGEYIDEPFLTSFRNSSMFGSLTNNFKVTVPEGHVFVMGDNRRESYDSRHFGPIEIEKIVGKVNIRYWPFDEFSLSFD